MTLRIARDTFAHFMQDQLDPYGVPVRVVRSSPDSPGSEMMQEDYVNIEFTDVSLGTLAKFQVCIDILHQSEDTASDWLDSVWAVLSDAFMARAYDWSDPEFPEDQGKNIMWDLNSVRFRKVNSGVYSHYTCTLPLRFTAIEHK